MNFDILDTESETRRSEDNTYTANPYVTIYTTTTTIRKKWNDNAFQVTLTFTL